MAKRTKKQVAADEVRDGKSLTTRGKAIRAQADSVASRKTKVKTKLLSLVKLAVVIKSKVSLTLNSCIASKT